MLDIILEYRKGILFVRLGGELSKNTVNYFNEKVKEKIKRIGIRNVVFNIENVLYIDLKGANSLLCCYEICKKNHGESMVCGLSSSLIPIIRKTNLLRYMKEVSNELLAIKILDI